MLVCAPLKSNSLRDLSCAIYHDRRFSSSGLKCAVCCSHFREDMCSVFCTVSRGSVSLQYGVFVQHCTAPWTEVTHPPFLISTSGKYRELSPSHSTEPCSNPGAAGCGFVSETLSVAALQTENAQTFVQQQQDIQRQSHDVSSNMLSHPPQVSWVITICRTHFLRDTNGLYCQIAGF